MNLNIGCGSDDYGDVRLDIDYHTQTGIVSKLNIRADAHYLPFKDKSFEYVKCWHCIEHTAKPMQVIREIERVSYHYSIRFPSDNGYTKRLFVTLVNLRFTDFILTYKTMKGRFHRWAIRGGHNTERCIPVPSFFTSGRKARFLSRFSVKYQFEKELSR
jgi:SAM-dependent methyltransferase